MNENRLELGARDLSALGVHPKGPKLIEDSSGFGGPYKKYEIGRCVCCDAMTHLIVCEDEISGDPRGEAGEHAATMVLPEEYPDRVPEGVDPMRLRPLLCCFLCCDSDYTYNVVLDSAQTMWSRHAL